MTVQTKYGTTQQLDRQGRKISLEATYLASIDAKLPAVAVGADAVANPTLSKIFTFLMGFNGTSWDRLRTAVVSITSTLTGFLNTIPYTIYHASPSTRAEGQGGPQESDINGNTRTVEQYIPKYEDNVNQVAGVLEKPVASATYAPSFYSYWAGAITKKFIKSSAGNVYSLTFKSTSSSLRYLQLHNKASDPAAAEAPLFSFPVPAGTPTQPAILTLDKDFFAPSGYFSLGIGWAVSTTEATFTDAATASEHSIQVNYV